MIHKMKCTRGEVLQRIGQIGSKMDQQEAEAAKNVEGGAAAAAAGVLGEVIT